MRLDKHTTIFVYNIDEFRKVVSLLDQELYNHTTLPHMDEPNDYQFGDEEPVSMYIEDDKIHWCNDCLDCINGCIKKDSKIINFEDVIIVLRKNKLNRILDEESI